MSMTTEGLSLRMIAASLRGTEVVRVPTLASASTDLFMATMRFYAEHREILMPEELTTTLLLLRTASDSEVLVRRLIFAVDIIEDVEAAADQAVLLALGMTRLLLGAQR